MFNTVTVWLIIGVLLLLSEFLIPGFTIFFFGVGALITTLLVFLIPPLQDIVWLQIVIFLIISIVSLVTLRRFFNVSLKGEVFKERDDYTGRECLIVEGLSEKKKGRIKYQGTTWSAFSEKGKFKKGQKATILGKKPGDPMVFIVKK